MFKWFLSKSKAVSNNSILLLENMQYKKWQNIKKLVKKILLRVDEENAFGLFVIISFKLYLAKPAIESQTTIL